MNATNRNFITGAVMCAVCLLAAAITAYAQLAPVMTVTPTATNTLSITITNGVSGANYELWSTPVLANPDYPWTIANVGGPNHTNFIVNLGTYPSGFYRAVWDTNAIPLWEAADPNNPSAGILSVFIDSPANGSTITQ
jgi:hypothetical protein